MTSARDRMRAYRERLRGVNTTARGQRCTACAAFLSIYSEPGSTLCAPCFRIYGTHEQYVDEQLQRTRQARPSEFVCQRGHDLEQHGKIVHAGGGRYTRRCNACRKERQREYQRRRRARLAAA